MVLVVFVERLEGDSETASVGANVGGSTGAAVESGTPGVRIIERMSFGSFPGDSRVKNRSPASCSIP